MQDHPLLNSAQRKALLERFDAELARHEAALARDGVKHHEPRTRLDELPAHAQAIWSDQDTQAVPLTLRQANLATDVEVDMALAHALWGQRKSIERRVLHWMSGHVLLGVVDVATWRVGLRRLVAKTLLDETAFVARPETAHVMPDGFRSSTAQDTFWHYGLFSPLALEAMPRRLLREPIELRQLPEVSPGLISPRHRHMMRMLAQQPRRFEELRQILAAPQADLQHDIAALFFCGAIAAQSRGSSG